MSGATDTPETHDCGADVAAYVLGALEPNEVVALRSHLDVCAICRDEVEALQGVANALPLSAPQQPASRQLRRRVMREVRDGERSRSGSRARTGGSWMLRPVMGAVALAAVVAIVLGISLSGGGGSGRLIRAQVAGVTGSAQVRVAGARGELIVRHFSAPPAGHVYEVWLKRGSRAPVPASVLFTVNSKGSADVGLPNNLKGVDTVMVTPEPDGGSPQPTHSPVVVAQLT
jgi:anti-sigma-K factor RskA